jgi:ABC-type Mn2+/Zn2+ transport system permease subunit
VRTLEYLTDPALAPLYAPGLVTALAVALLGAPLSVFVVLKRLAFIGQGVSHAAFGGVGVAVVVSALTGLSAFGAVGQSIVGASCVAAAVAIWWLSSRPDRHADTAIGVVLAGSMALGLALHRWGGDLAARAGQLAPPSLESVLFGAVWEAGWPSAWAAIVLCVGVTLALVVLRRPLVFWAFDEPASAAAGVRAGTMRLALLVLLALAVLGAVRLAGVVLATALLILPGVTALELARSMRRVIALSVALALAGVAGGLVLSFETGLATGPSIVFAMVGVYGAARVTAIVVARRDSMGPSTANAR